MRTNLVRGFGVALVAFVILVLCIPDAQSQRRKRTSRRASHPVRTQPVATPALPDEPSVVSTADEPQQETPRRTTTRKPSSTQAENDRLHNTVRDLSDQVDKLSGELNQMKTDQRAMYDLERLTRAEQRAEDLRGQLREITDKEFLNQERLAEIDYELQPDSIQRRAALTGSLNPSAVREALQQQFERERARIQKQLESLATSHARLETALASADAEVDRLRQRVEAADQAGTGVTGAPTTNTPPPAPTPSPQPTPTPNEPPK
jgi:outer membrane murein-binding lipoprotein Lpp